MASSTDDLEFFFDPVCPWAWITSRWVKEVQELRQYSVTWRPISLKILNANQTAEWYTAEYKRGHAAGHDGLRTACALVDHFGGDEGNEAVDRFYSALGIAAHKNGRRDEFRDNTAHFIDECLTIAGLSTTLNQTGQSTFDDVIATSTSVALERTGKDVGTPILTFHPGQVNEGSFFGPVIARIPRGEEALTLWNAVEVVATTPGVAELKRTLRSKPVFD
ncbi:MAG: hypothetical protein O3B91_02315 [Actinomycetota bacterium]|nr:hypothetical protein [Actinomycetota bacterium]MDA3019022.1 hypothetical protein [Actinomycetota bacterium]